MTIFGFASRFSSTTTRVFSSDSSRMALMSVSTFPFTNSAMRPTSVARLTLYGISVITICSRPHFSSSTPALPRTFILPRPVSRYCRIPDTADRAAGRKIRALHVFHQLVQGDVWVLDLRADSIDNFSKIVRRNIGGHANRDAGSTIDKKVRKRRWKNCRFGPRLIVIGDEVDRVLVHVGHECGAQMRHPRFGVTHGRRRIAFD